VVPRSNAVFASEDERSEFLINWLCVHSGRDVWGF
jgi:hypothetical protein